MDTKVIDVDLKEMFAPGQPVIALTGKREKFQWNEQQVKELDEALRDILGLPKPSDFKLNKFRCID